MYYCMCINTTTELISEIYRKLFEMLGAFITVSSWKGMYTRRFDSSLHIQDVRLQIFSAYTYITI